MSPNFPQFCSLEHDGLISSNRKTLWLRISLLVFLLHFPVAVQAQDFSLTEHLGRSWTNELVTFQMTPEQQLKAEQGAGLFGVSGQSIAYQVADTAEIAFQVSLLPFATRSFTFDRNATVPETDLSVTESAEAVVISNSHVGIALRKSMGPGEGPVGGIRLRSGYWTDGSNLQSGARVSDYRLEQVASGPIFAEVICHVTFADRGTWSMRVRVLNDEPVILIEEAFDAPSGGQMIVPLGGKQNFPDQLIYRQGKGQLGKFRSWSIEQPGEDSKEVSADSWIRGWVEFARGRWVGATAVGQAFTLEPWLRWWMNERQGNWFAVFNSENSSGSAEDLLMVGALRPAQWKDPDWNGRAPQLVPLVPVDIEQGLTVLRMPLGGGSRHWMLGTPLRSESVDLASNQAGSKAPLPQQYLIKHGDFPLNEVKDYVLNWPGDHTDYPRLFIDSERLSQLREELETEPEEVQRWSSRQPIDKYNIEDPLRAWFSSGDPDLGQAIVQRSLQWLSLAVNQDLLDQSSRVTLGVAPHNQSVQLLPTINLTDAALSCDCLTEDQRSLMLAQLAFLAYALNRDDYWSPQRDFAANPNMTTTVELFRVALAALIPSHPKANDWTADALSELRRQLQEWSDQDGGWLEAPHYALVSYDHILGAFVMANNAGFGDFLHQEKIRNVIEWLAAISTPPDRRTDGFRHLPPIGNTYLGETTGLFGIVAGLWQEHDPVFAAEMQWMSEAHGYSDIGLLGPFGTFSGYRSLLRQHEVLPQPPDYGTRWFEQTGVVFRTGFDSGRETYLHLIAGTQHEHYDFDSGSIVLWGKGSLLANDFGYIGRHASKWHSLMTSSSIPDRDVMKISEFAGTDRLDISRGSKGPWRRDIAFFKDHDPLGANGFLIRDHHDARGVATWKIWLASTDIELHDRGATMIGEDDIDLDLFFFDPARLNLTLEPTVQEGKGRQGSRVGSVQIHQTALVASLNGRGNITALLYPRLKTEPSPTVDWFADGAGVQITHPSGTDVVFLGSSETRRQSVNYPIAMPDGTSPLVQLDCTTCLLQLRPDRRSLTLGAGGRIRFGDSDLEGLEPISRTELH